ncbi:DUF397 domain-containing protein [Actinomadura sp. 21ATH]|uniref:DUF397 domain-containing protein n=1 Tax=Actinomadura sp. 21ATH TaxID=1735444 RepID=UPI0035BF67ED
METHAHYFRWKKSSACGPSAACIEVARLTRQAVGVRDSRRTEPSAPVLNVAVTDWARFVALIKNGDMDRPR